MLAEARYHAGQALWAGMSRALRRWPGIRQRFWQGFYNRGAALIPDDRCVFLNWGWLDPAAAADPALAEAPDLLERLSAGLYDHVLAGVELEGRDVLEVGCGRGGGSVHIARTHRPASIVGIDASDRIVAWCTAHHDEGNVRFEHGFASDLPLAPASVDVVVCVESSHCYPSRLGFFREAARVLRPGGRLVLADFIWPNDEAATGAAVGALLPQAGLEPARMEPVTPGVLASRRTLSRSRAFQARLPSLVGGVLEQRSVAEAWALEGTTPFADLDAGALEYWCWVAVKPG